MTTPTKPGPERRAGELGPRELARFIWRQLTSMRTALILLLVLALAAVPGSIIPQQSVDALKTSRWKDAHPKLTPIYERLDMFDVYSSVWFSAIYLLLMVSLVGCIIPRTFHYLRNIRAVPPAAPRNLTRLPEHATYESALAPDDVLARARKLLKKTRYRLRPRVSTGSTGEQDSVSAERGYLREVGNLIFHLSVLVVLVGFGIGGLFGYKGGVILVEGSTFGNNLTQYDDFDPGSLFEASDMEPFAFDFDKFDVEWVKDGPRAGMARAFDAKLHYRESPGSAEKSFNLRVNHPLAIGNTEVFLIGHGYAPEVTIRDGEGNVTWSGPQVFLPQDQTFLSFGVIKPPGGKPARIGLEGLFYPTFNLIDGNPTTVYPNDLNPLISMLLYTGDLGQDTGESQSVYVLDKSDATQVKGEDGKPFRLDLKVGETATLPDGLGTVTFDGVRPWTKIQISQTPGKRIALGGVSLALVGLLMSLFLRPRRVWVRARREGGVTMVEVAVLDRSGGGDIAEVLRLLMVDLLAEEPEPEGSSA